MNVAESQVALIDQRIRAAAQMTRAVGSCVNRDVIGPGALVLFDGSTVAIPVKVLGHVELRDGMRCTLDLYGSEWLVTGAFATPVLGEAYKFVYSGTATTTSASFVDITPITPFSFEKFHDNTNVEYLMSVSGYATVGSTQGRWALRFTQVSGENPYTPANLNANDIYWSAANNRLYNTTVYFQPNIPAGVYNVQVRWCRTSGTGTLTNASDDLYSIRLRETAKPASPYM